MNKISVGETILHGYGFAVRRLLANLGLTWLAAVFYAVSAGYWLQQFCTTMLVSPHPGNELNDFALFDLFCLVVVTALGNAVIARALTGAALEPGGETMTAYLAVAKREWILFLSLLRLYAFIVVTLAAVVILGGLTIRMALPMIGTNDQWHGIHAQSAMNAVEAVCALIVVATLAVRLGFFAAPVASAEGSASMGRAWALSRGNSWRLFAALVGMSLPALLLCAAAGWAMIGNDLAGAITTAVSPSHDSTAFYQLINDNALALAGIWTVLLVVLNMLFAGAAAPAYLMVRDNVTAPRTRSMPRTPMLEPVFAGSFAGFAPRDAQQGAVGDMRIAPGTEPLAAPSDAKTAAQASIVEEPDTALFHAEDGVTSSAIAQGDHLLAEDEEAPEMISSVMPDADMARNLPAESTDTGPVEHSAEANGATPPPLHADGTESSQQNVPSEAA
jgi:hypothetical protein